MTAANHDADRIVRAFLQEGPGAMSAPLAARIRAEVEETNQRTRLRPWRSSAMPRAFWILAPVAALTIAVGAMLLMGGGAVPGPSPTATLSPTTLPSATQGATSTPAASPYPLAPGEAWIVVGGDNLATLIRPDGSGRHDILVRIGATVWDPAWSPDG